MKREATEETLRSYGVDGNESCGICGDIFPVGEMTFVIREEHWLEGTCKGCQGISMTEVTAELDSLGIEAKYLHSGGGCGTVYIGDVDAAGMYEYALGPSDYRSNIGRRNELNLGPDGEDASMYLSHITPFTPKEVAAAIHSFIQWDRNAETRKGIK